MLIKMVGFAFVSAAAELLLCGSRFGKYIKTVLGIIFISVMLSALPSFKSAVSFAEMSAADGCGMPDENVFDEALKKEVVLSCEKEIKEKLASEGIEIKSLIIDFDGDYNIKKIRAYPYNPNDGKRITEILNEHFEIDKGVIEICGDFSG